MSIENMKKVKARIGFKWRKYWNASTLFGRNLLGNIFKLLIHASLFSALQFWKWSARKIFAVEKAEVSANLQNEAIG